MAEPPARGQSKEASALTDTDPKAGPSDAGPPGPATTRARPLGILLTFLVAFVAIGGVAAFFISETYTSPNYPNGVQVAQPLGTTVVNGQTLPHVSLAFQTYPDSTGTVDGKPVHPSGSSSWPAYGFTNQFQVPAHALVTVTIRQYDSGGSLNNPFFSHVAGTVGGTATVTDPGGKTQTVTSWDPNNIGHTFTMRHYTVTFSFISGSKGVYAWNCEFPCGSMVASFGGVMGAYGFMSGFVHVV